MCDDSYKKEIKMNQLTKGCFTDHQHVVVLNNHNMYVCVYL